MELSFVVLVWVSLSNTNLSDAKSNLYEIGSKCLYGAASSTSVRGSITIFFIGFSIQQSNEISTLSMATNSRFGPFVGSENFYPRFVWRNSNFIEHAYV